MTADRQPRGPGGFGLYLRGVAMGLAELVPGVSGGTIAFITGIYLELVGAIRGVGEAVVRHLPRGEWTAAWRRANGGFLLLLGAGMASGILALARVVSWFLENRVLQTGGFFFGLILASVFFVGRFARPFTPARQGLLALGMAAGAAAAFATALALPVNPVTIFLGGMVAVCAWVLPGVSGSFIMLLLGLYPAVVGAISRLDVGFLAVLAAGCTVGLLLFSRLLGWLLERYYAATLSLLCGFMAGSLLGLWPWSLPRAVVEGKAVGVRLHLPGGFEAAGGGEPAVGGVILAFLLGVGVVAGLEYLARVRGVSAPPTTRDGEEVPEGA